jgi:PAS domain S-box-containing protein
MILDFNAMKRFGIPEGSLPEGSIVINRPDTFYHKYKVYVWITASAFIVLSSMVFLLTYLLRMSRKLGSQLLEETIERRKAVIELQNNRDHLETIVNERTEELRKTNDALGEREQLFHSMFDANSAVMYLLNPRTGRIIEVNLAAAEYYGYKKAEMESMDIYTVNLISKEKMNANMNLAITGQENIFEYRHRKANGDIRDIEVHSSPIEYKGEKILFSIVHDITDRKLAENEREKLIAELKKALAEVKTLSGLLPICSSCKKIRNDAGYWEQIEEYISDHSGAEFSHSLCPDCIKKLYPGLKIK